MVSVEEIYAALREVEDPELPVSVVDLGLVRGVETGPGSVRVRMTFTSLACPCTDLIKEDVRDRLRRLDGVDEVEVEEVFESWSRADLSDEARTILRALAVI
jgi:metal-sulfur cluster biosynthetic enzyme